MKSKIAGAILIAASILSGADWQIALPGYRYQFPRDHFSHPDYQTEWWYYTGNLRAPDGHRFGFELTFFRQGTSPPGKAAPPDAGAWDPKQIYLAHLAFSDLDGREFFHTERLNRAGPGLAGADFADRRYWNGNWSVDWIDFLPGKQKLQAVADNLILQLELTPAKPFVVNGENGISQKGPARGEASHYVSFTRLEARGKVDWKTKKYSLTGLAWMDHEYFTEPPDSSLAGWDWFAIQLDNNQELMLYRLRRNSTAQDPYSSGTYVDGNGRAHFLKSSDFVLTPSDTWLSPDTKARYPISWKISVPSLQLDLQQKTVLPSQELFNRGQQVTAPYWEGAVSYSGQMGTRPVEGVGYLEMTGYSERVKLGTP